MARPTLVAVIVFFFALPFPNLAQLPPETRATAMPLFLAIPENALDGLEHRVDFVVTESLGVTLKESLLFTSAPNTLAGRPAIEVLSLHPQLLARLQKGASHNNAHFSVYLDDSLLEEGTLLDITRQSQELQRQDLFLIGVRGRLTAKADSIFSKALTGYGCVHPCELAAQTCDNNCLSRPIPNCENNCDNRLTNCLKTCGCPVAIGDLPTVTTFLGYTPQATVCLFDVPNGTPQTDGHYYDRYTGTYKHEHYQEVVQCDDLHTSALTSVDYTFTTCYKRRVDLPGECIPQGQIFGQCVIN